MEFQDRLDRLLAIHYFGSKGNFVSFDVQWLEKSQNVDLQRQLLSALSQRNISKQIPGQICYQIICEKNIYALLMSAWHYSIQEIPKFP